MVSTHEVFRRQKIAEEVVDKLRDAVKQRVAESDKKSSHLPNETRAIVRVYNGLLLWLCEGYSDKILWFYQYGSIPCWQRMSMFDRDVNTAIILLKDKNKAALAADIESRWQNIIQTAKKTDKTLSELRERYNHDEDNPAYTNDVKSALFDIKTYASQLGESLFEVAKQQTTKTEQPAEAEQKTPAKITNIGNFKGVLGDVQAENVQTGNYSSIHKQTEEKNKGKIKAIVTIVSFLAALLTCIYLLWWLWTKFSG